MNPNGHKRVYNKMHNWGSKHYMKNVNKAKSKGAMYNITMQSYTYQITLPKHILMP
jgi:hypothetical protein